MTTMMQNKVRIALFTVMGFAIETAISQVVDKRKDVELAVVVTCTGPKSRRSDAHLEVLTALWKTRHFNVDVVISNTKSKYLDIMMLYKVDLIISIGFPWLLPENILHPKKYPGSPRLGGVNFHNSLLPKYRGPNAFGWAICNGDEEFGFCSHRMEGEFDAGDVLVTDTIKNETNEMVGDLFEKLRGVFCNMVEKSLDMILAGEPGSPQIGEPSYAPKFTDSFRCIDFAELTALEVHNRVRAFYGARDIPFGALATVIDSADKKFPICITRTFFNNDMKETSHLQAGQISSQLEEGKSFHVRCKDKTLEVLEWERHSKISIDC